jgi:hypothetical protein
VSPSTSRKPNPLSSPCARHPNRRGSAAPGSGAGRKNRIARMQRRKLGCRSRRPTGRCWPSTVTSRQLGSSRAHGRPRQLTPPHDAPVSGPDQPRRRATTRPPPLRQLRGEAENIVSSDTIQGPVVDRAESNSGASGHRRASVWPFRPRAAVIRRPDYDADGLTAGATVTLFMTKATPGSHSRASPRYRAGAGTGPSQREADPTGAHGRADGAVRDDHARAAWWSLREQCLRRPGLRSGAARRCRPRRR